MNDSTSPATGNADPALTNTNDQSRLRNRCPGVIRNLLLGAFAGAAACWVLPWLRAPSAAQRLVGLSTTMAIIFMALALLMLRTGHYGKRIAARNLLRRAGIARRRSSIDPQAESPARHGHCTDCPHS